MPWYGDYAMEGWANDNTAETWKTVMNNDFVITLEDMPGWDKYELADVSEIASLKGKQETKTNFKSAGTRLIIKGNKVQVHKVDQNKDQPKIFDLTGKKFPNN